MKSKIMIELIKDVEQNQHGIQKMYASRIAYFQHTYRDDKTVACEYDEDFNQFVKDMEQTIGGKIYRPTAKKILNNWFLWAYEQRQALKRLRLKRIYSTLN